MAKAVKKKSAIEASNIFHNIMAASVNVNPKANNMTKEKVVELKKDMSEKFQKYVNEVESDNTGGISTSKHLWLAALTAWENAWKKYIAENKKKR